MKFQSRSHRSGFTLIEMLTVITIIVILSGMVIGGMQMVKDKQAISKAKVQVALLSQGLEAYKADQQTYPVHESATGKDGSNVVFKALFWDTDNDGKAANEDDDQKIYLSDLDPNSNKQGWIDGSGSETRLNDPWSNEYRYRTGTSASNPDFDLWSVGKDGKSDPDDPKAKDSLDDLRNN